MLNIKHPQADQLARVLAKKLDKTITEVIIEALQEKWLREQGKRAPDDLKNSLLEIGKRCSELPDKDKRSIDKILGYDEDGLPR